MDLDYILRGIRSLGLRTVVATLRYSWLRDRLNLKFAKPQRGRVRPPGQLLRQDPTPTGSSFLFQATELEISFLSASAVRVTWGPGQSPPPYNLAQAPDPPPTIQKEKIGKDWELRSDQLTLLLSPSGDLTYRTASGEVLRKEYPPTRRGEQWQLRSHLLKSEAVCGLGERAATLNLRPGRYRFWNSDPGGSYGPDHDPLYLCIPLYQSLQPVGSYLMYYENPFDGTISFDEEARIEFSGGQLRSLFILGEPKSSLQQLAELIGRPALPPRWALGYHHSRWGYQDLEEIERVIEGFEKHDLPLNALHLDIDYMHDFRVFTQDPERFPDLRSLSHELDEKFRAKLVVILDPGVKIDSAYALYQEGMELDTFCKLPNGEPLSGVVWPGWVHFPDFSNPQARDWWGRQYKFLMDQGVDGFWHDMNEPTSFAAWGPSSLPQATQHDVEGHGGNHQAIHNLYGLLMNRAGYEGLQALTPDKRPWLLSRSGWAGLCRYAWHWTGDTESSWEMLATTISTVLGLGLSGVPYTGPDIGGFSGDPSDELYLRWFQMAAFMPFFRNHSSKLAQPREPWTFNEDVMNTLRRILKLRQSFMPYLYTLVEESHRLGWPMARPLFWQTPNEPSLWSIDDSFLLGDNLLVAPVLAEGVEERNVRFPAGTWVDFWTEQRHHGPGEVTVPAPLDRIPLLVRSGAILPRAEPDGLMLEVFPPGPDDSPCNSSLYQDAGDGFGPSRLDQFHCQQTSDGWSIDWESSGDYEFPYEELSIQFRAPLPSSIRVDGEKQSLVADRFSTIPFTRLEALG